MTGSRMTSTARLDTDQHRLPAVGEAADRRLDQYINEWHLPIGTGETAVNDDLAVEEDSDQHRSHPLRSD